MKGLADLHRGESFRWAFSATHDVDVLFEGERRMSDALVSLIRDWLMALVLIGCAVYYFLHVRFTIRRLIRGSEFVEVNQSEMPGVIAISKSIASDMAISLHRLAVIWIDDETVSPSIVDDRRRLALFVPTGFLVLADSEPRLARAILAHEFGHVLLGDTRLWLFSVSAQRTLMRFRWPVLVPLLLGSDLIPIFLHSRLGAILVLWTVASAFLLYCVSISFVFWARRRSERLADTIAVHFSGKSSLADAVRLVSSTEITDEIHLSSSERLSFIESL